MIRILSLPLLCFLLVAGECNEENLKKVLIENQTQVQWITQEKDLGIITKKKEVVVLFELKNIGEKPLIITDIVPGCGCTLVQRPEGPVLPNEKYTIEAKYKVNAPENSFVKKDIKVYGNFTPSPKILSFIGKVRNQSIHLQP